MDVRSYVRSTRFTVIVAAIWIAIPAGYGVLEVTGNESLAFLAMFTLGVSVPQVYARSWPTNYDRLEGIAWTVGACAIALVVVVAAFYLMGPFFTDFWAAVAAFAIAQLSISATSRRIEARSAADGDADDVPVGEDAAEFDDGVDR